MYRGNGAGGWAPNVPERDRHRLGLVHRVPRARRLQRRRQARRAGARRRRPPADVPRQRRGRLGRGRRARPSAAAGAASPRCSRPATSAATASPTSSRATPAAPCCMYRGDGDGGWLTGTAEKIGSGWGPFTLDPRRRRLQRRRQARRARRQPRRRAADVPRQRRRRLGSPGTAEPVGIGLGRLHGAGRAAATSAATARPTCSPASPTAPSCSTAATAPAAGSRATASRSAAAGTASTYLTLVAGLAPPPAPAPDPPARAARPRCRTATCSLTAGLRCTPPGGLLRVSVKVRRRSGRPAPRVQRIVFFVRNGPRRTDRRRPYSVRLRMHRPAGQRGRVYARVYYRRAGSKTLRHKTVSRRFVMCGARRAGR